MTGAFGSSMTRPAKRRGLAACVVLAAVAALALTVAAQARLAHSPSQRVPCRTVCVKVVHHPPPHVSSIAGQARQLRSSLGASASPAAPV
jgi:hypothetical protein